MGVVLVLLNFALSWIVYYPFFKVYDKQCVDEEKAEQERKERLAAKKASRAALADAEAE